ncbi:MAG: hypothetical protein Q4G58_05965 [bacterium]|nr:hypothetical protein [bacterium]
MYVLQNSYILDYLDLPTIPWEQCYTTSTLDDSILWTVKNEPYGEKQGKIYGRIGITSNEAKAYISSEYKNLEHKRMLIYYPYYTATKSGTIDLSYDRIVIEAVEGKIENLKKKHRVNETIIFRDESIEIFGDEDYMTKEETLTLIDYAKQLKKRASTELEFGKNLIFYWSFVQETKRNMIPRDETRLLFHQIKVLGA